METDQKLKLLHEGQMASLVSEQVAAFIRVFKERKINELSQNFRMGKIDQATLLSSVSGLCALEDLENEMKRKIVRAEKISNDMHKEQLK